MEHITVNHDQASAETLARRTAACAVLEDFRRLTAAGAVTTGPMWQHWACRLAAELGHVLGVPPAEGDVRGSRTASGVDPGGVATIVPQDLGTVLGALRDAARLHEERATSWCPRCRPCPRGLCEEHLADAAAAVAYLSLGFRLGDDR